MTVRYKVPINSLHVLYHRTFVGFSGGSSPETYDTQTCGHDILYWWKKWLKKNNVAFPDTIRSVHEFTHCDADVKCYQHLESDVEFVFPNESTLTDFQNELTLEKMKISLDIH